MRKCLIYGVLTLAASLPLAGAARQIDWLVVQPAETSRNLVLFSKPGRALIEDRGVSTSHALGDAERLTSIVELRDGWAAAGQIVGDGRSRIVVVSADSQGMRHLSLPEKGAPALQLGPRLLTDGGRLRGVAWVEGPTARETAVRARVWTGAAWSEAVTVSPAGRGTQTGLAAATLRDGTELLIWSAYDGYDDEILFSENRGGQWSEPERVSAGNREPDVMPTLAATDRGALAAWNRGGENGYELVVATYRNGRWTEIRSRTDGLFPRLLTRSGSHYLTFRAEDWTVAELSVRGRELRTAQSSESPRDRPALEVEALTGPRFRWPERPAHALLWSQP